MKTDQAPVVPQAPPRRKSSDKLVAERREAAENSTSGSGINKYAEAGKENERPDHVSKDMEVDKEQIVSVKERTQKFNRLASVEDDSPKIQKPKKTPVRSNNKVSVGDSARLYLM